MAADVAHPSPIDRSRVLSTAVTHPRAEVDTSKPLRIKVPVEDQEVTDAVANGLIPGRPPVAALDAMSSIKQSRGRPKPVEAHEEQDEDSDGGSDHFTDAKTTPLPSTPDPRALDHNQPISRSSALEVITLDGPMQDVASTQAASETSGSDAVRRENDPQAVPDRSDQSEVGGDQAPQQQQQTSATSAQKGHSKEQDSQGQSIVVPATGRGHSKNQSSQGKGISDWSHQKIASMDNDTEQHGLDNDVGWQVMPAIAPFDMYNDDNKLIAREAKDSDDEADAYAGLGGAGKGYTRLQLEEDAQSATSLDENTQYLFKDINGGTGAGEVEDEEQRDLVSQLQTTKTLLTEAQKIAYVGMTRLIMTLMITEAEIGETTSKETKKNLVQSAQALQLWSQKMMVRLYAHLDISTDEQIMIEQLADHGVLPADLTSTLMQNARVKNPMAETSEPELPIPSPRPSMSSSSSKSSTSRPVTPQDITILDDEKAAPPPLPYEKTHNQALPSVRTPNQLPTGDKLDIDLRWTVLCDLFLTLIADSVYDARSRVLLERVGKNLEITWLDICRFEKRVTDALEMQQEADKEKWNEDEHVDSRRKLALKRRYIVMGLATVGGGLVIGLSAGLLAPMIGAGLAAGFSTVGIAGTSGFLAGAGGAAVITTGATTVGSVIGVRAGNRRTGAVKTFEYRPLHNNKRVNLIVTVSGWMAGKVDDVRLPFSTIDPVMGDIYSILWEPEMLQSTGATINILATEALTQGLQQVLGSTILIGLMAALQLPIVLSKLAYLIDNPWTVSLDRANSAGLILADSLIDRNLGTRPITFVGYSLGCRMIFSCLQELARKGAYGLVQNVYLFGSPIVAKKDEFLKVRSVVSGRFVNGFAKNDWILGYLFRMTSGGISRVAGLAPVEGISGLENVDVTEIVPGHMSYRQKMPRLLREVGWIVESDEFTEIEDPDPDDHSKRHRELINEIEEARKEVDKKDQEKESKGRFGLFDRWKKAPREKQEWETYQKAKVESSPTRVGDGHQTSHGDIFDVDAILAELANQQMEVKELKSTLPPMKLVIDPNPRGANHESPRSPWSITRETQSYSAPSPIAASIGQRSLSTSPPASSRTSAVSIDKNTATAHEEKLEMTCDNSGLGRARSNAASTDHLPLQKLAGRPAELPDRSASSQRVNLQNTNTLPAPMSIADVTLDHNAWADDDEDFGREREMEMTFA